MAMPAVPWGSGGFGGPQPPWARGDLRASCTPAVQEERQRSRERAESEAEGAAGGRGDMPVGRILEAELAVEPKTESYGDVNVESSVGDPNPPSRLPVAGRGCGRAGCVREPQNLPPCALFLFQMNDPVTNICHAADKQLFTLVEWAKRIPHFSDLTLEDQVILLRAGEGQRGSFLLGMVAWVALLELPLGTAA